ncbi:MAG TPA: DUF389 domain-containing protein [Nocardioidaceae bacterium]|nr:DUF389 domain-containing protein [Nocardioidaceae bacterium]
MLHLQLRVPGDRVQDVVDLFDRDETVTNVAVFENGYTKPPGTMVIADVAREGANPVVAALHRLGLRHDGSIMLSEPSTLISDAAVEAEHAAPGEPDDGVVWDVVENRVDKESRLSWSFCAFLTLATLIAGAGRLLDQQILIVGAMVVGPEFSPVAAICVALARGRPGLLRQGASTLALGYVLAIAIATPLWFLAFLTGGVSAHDAANGQATAFIIQPGVWSFLIAVLAGIAGVLALTSSKSGTLIGVFISVTTVPAAGTIALCIGTGVWWEVNNAAIQLGVNLLGLILAGTATLLVQRVVWSRIVPTGRVRTF